MHGENLKLKEVSSCICVFLRTNSDLCHLHHKLIGFYNRDEKCLLRGTNWVFKRSRLRFVFKGLKIRSCVCKYKTGNDDHISWEHARNYFNFVALKCF